MPKGTNETDTANLAGKASIVTGAGQGGGRGAALALARQGVAVTLFGRTRSKLALVADEITRRGGRSLVVAGDVTSQEDRNRLLDETLERFGRIDILVNSAISPEQRDSPLLTVTRETIDDLWESGFVAMIELMRACHPHMKRQGGGSIINFGSGTQTVPKNFCVYAAVKAGVQAMSRGAALEWASDNIRVNTVFPMVQSPAYDSFKKNNPDAWQAFEASMPLGRIGHPEADIGRAIAFLAGDDAAYVTGATLPLDGGHAFVR